MTNFDPSEFFPVQEFGEILETARLTMGMSGDTLYAVKTAKGDFVLRIQNRDKQAWEQGVMMQALAADQGIAPALLMVDKQRSVTISHKVSGIAFGHAVAQPDTRNAALASLVDQLAQLHRIPTAGLLPRNPLAMGRLFWGQQSQRPGFPAWAIPLGSRLDAIELQLATDARQVFSHCDLNPANMMWDGKRVWLIDWEGAGLAHPYLDLATISNFMSLPDEPALELLAAQEQTTLDAEQKKTFVALRDLVRLVYGAVFFSLVPDLQAIPFASREQTLALPQYYARLGTGELRMGEPLGQALFGAALLLGMKP